jgi:glycine/D-amino acid oxidase-like deaminating enzyme
MKDVVIVGAGICGLSLALNLHRRGISCRVFERVPQMTELGVGITLLPHAMRELVALGLGDALLRAGIENRSSRFFNRFGQLIYEEPRGKFAGYAHPEIGIHRGRLQMILYRAALHHLEQDGLQLGARQPRREPLERGLAAVADASGLPVRVGAFFLRAPEKKPAAEGTTGGR